MEESMKQTAAEPSSNTTPETPIEPAGSEILSSEKGLDKNRNTSSVEPTKDELVDHLSESDSSLEKPRDQDQ